MYTSLDKALVALIMSAVGVVGIIWHPLNISPEAVTAVVGTVTPILVYFWPNAPKG
jgi:hypothetical protein